MKKILCFILFYIFIGASASYAQQAMILPLDAVPLKLATKKGDVKYDVEIAFSPEQTEQGLMFREDFPKNRAMLFKFYTEQEANMWMANTPLPLDMIFLNKQGQIVSIVENTTPFSKAVISSGKPASFVIELNAGQVKQHNIKIADKAIHPVICGKCEK